MKQKILILGANGMVGHKLFDRLSHEDNLDIYATVRSQPDLGVLAKIGNLSQVTAGVDVAKISNVEKIIKSIKPEWVINCIGITKQLTKEEDPKESIEINALYPHLLAGACKRNSSRMIHFTTDCVFNGSKGNYKETDASDATDLYGRSKFLGEVKYQHCLSIRTSFIGHELGTNHGLVEWFLSQSSEAKGFTEAIYSGMPTVVLADILIKHILPSSKLSGLYHLSATPINKYELLKLVANAYGKKINIKPDATVKIDRSLDSTLLREAIGLQTIAWERMVQIMFEDYQSCNYYRKYN